MILKTTSDLECYNVFFVRIHQMWPNEKKVISDLSHYIGGYVTIFDP